MNLLNNYNISVQYNEHKTVVLVVNDSSGELKNRASFIA